MLYLPDLSLPGNNMRGVLTNDVPQYLIDNVIIASPLIGPYRGCIGRVTSAQVTKSTQWRTDWNLTITFLDGKTVQSRPDATDFFDHSIRPARNFQQSDMTNRVSVAQKRSKEAKIDNMGREITLDCLVAFATRHGKLVVGMVKEMNKGGFLMVQCLLGGDNLVKIENPATALIIDEETRSNIMLTKLVGGIITQA